MDKLIPVLIIIGIIVLGFIVSLFELKSIIDRVEFTNNYHKKFVDLVNEIIENKSFNQHLYFELTLDVNTMQRELGYDGIMSYARDNLRGFATTDYQLLINFLPELKNILNGQDDYVLMHRYNQSIRDCDYMFNRHLGTLSEIKNSLRKKMHNPFFCFSNGVRIIISLPILLLHWFGFISDETTKRVKCHWIVKLINIIVTLVSFVSGLMSIIMGWNDFWKMIFKM